MCDWDNQTIFLEKHFYFNMLFAFIFLSKFLRRLKNSLMKSLLFHKGYDRFSHLIE